MGEEVTGGDLWKLWQVANVCMPRIANIYTDVNDGIAGTSNGETAAFSEGSGPHGGVYLGRVHGPWSNVRNEFQLLIAETAQAMIDSQTALNNAIEAYKSQDAAAAADFEDNYLNNPEKYNPNDPSQAPPTGENAPGKPTPPEYYTSPADE